MIKHGRVDIHRRLGLRLLMMGRRWRDGGRKIRRRGGLGNGRRSVLLQRHARFGSLFGALLNVRGDRNLSSISRPIGAVAIPKRLQRLLDAFPFGEFLPGPVETARTLRPSAALQKASRRVKRPNVTDDLLRQSPLLAGREARAVGGIVPRVDEGAKSLIPRMLSDVHPPAAQDVVVVDNNERPPMMRMVMRI